MTFLSPRGRALIWPMIRLQLILGGVLGVVLYAIGRPSASFGLLYGAVLGTINAFAMIGRLEEAVTLGPGKGKGFLQRGALFRFFVILALMSAGFYFFKFHVVSLLAGFILFQFVGMIFIWREMKKEMGVTTDGG